MPERRIETVLSTCLSIVFFNKSHAPPLTPIIHVCANREAYDKDLSRLAHSPWIEVIQSGETHVVWE